MTRFGRKTDPKQAVEELPLSAFYFDLLQLDGEDWIDRPTKERLAALDETIDAGQSVRRIVSDQSEEADAFFQRALADGHEGLMAKSLDEGYAAGSRGFAWLKLKPAHTLDLVVIGVERGSGRRRGWLSNLHLAARDPRDGSFAMLGKTFKGMTDEMLTWQTNHLHALALGEEGHVVHVKPELVVEIAFSDVQQSPTYPAGMALRFARVKRYRTDKSAADAATVDEVRAILAHGHRT
jgi:DNA ligase-1